MRDVDESERAVKLRDFKAVWDPRWVEAGEPGESSRITEEGKLVGLERLGSRLLLRINVNGRLRSASLSWTPPPSVADVETVLLASIGAEVRSLGDLELPATGSGARHRR